MSVSTCTLGRTYILCISPDATLLAKRFLYNLSKTLSPSLWRGCISTLLVQIVVLDFEVYPNMPRNWSKAVPEGNGPVLQQEEFGSDQPTLADVYRHFEVRFERQLKGVKSHLYKMDIKWMSLRRI